MKHTLVPLFARFMGAGCSSAGGHYGTLVVLVHFFAVDAVAASAAGALVGAAINYLMNRRFTFRSRRPHRQSVPRFVAVAASGLALNTLIMWIGVDVLKIHYLLSQLATTALVMMWSFGAHKLWTFSSDTS